MAAQYQIDQKNMDALLSELEVGLAPMIKSAKEQAVRKLAKSGEPEGSASAGGDAGGSPAPAAGGDAGGSASAGGDAGGPPAGSPPPDASASAPGSPSADPAASPDAGAGAAPGPEELEQAYAQLPVDQLKMHYIAAKSALFQKMGAGGGAPGGAPDMGGAPAGGSPSAPPAGPDMGGAPPAGGSPSAPPPPPPGASPDPTMKSEIDALKDSLKKTEARAAENEELVGKLAKGLQMLLKPERKAVTGVSFIAKSEDQKPAAKTEIDVTKLNKNDVSRILKPKMNDILSKGNKADRDAVLAYMNDEVDVTAIKHLIVG